MTSGITGTPFMPGEPRPLRADALDENPENGGAECTCCEINDYDDEGQDYGSCGNCGHSSEEHDG